MNLDQLPFTAFALEAAAAGAPSGGDGRTLTMPLRGLPALMRRAAEHEPMGGTVAIGASAPSEGAWRAAVVTAQATALTITF
jgi:hypothetical protein